MSTYSGSLLIEVGEKKVFQISSILGQMGFSDQNAPCLGIFILWHQTELCVCFIKLRINVLKGSEPSVC